MKTAYSYTRISTTVQLHGEGLRRQSESALAYCKTHNLRLDETLKLADEGLSAFHGDNLLRGKLGKFLELVDAKKIKRGSVLLVESLDRVSRANVLDAQELFLSIINRGITVVTLMDGQTYNREEISKNPGMLFMSLAVMIRANEESETKSKRVSHARNKRKEEAKSGKQFKIYTPPWCIWTDDKFQLDKQKLHVIERIFRMYLDGRGAQNIAAVLNAEKVPSFGRGMAPNAKDAVGIWYKKLVSDILKDKRLIGHAHWIDKDDYFPRAISKDLFNQVQHRMSTRKRVGGRIGNGPTNIFAGIVRCGHCGAAVGKTRSINRAGYEYWYLCCEDARSGKDTCTYRSILMDTIEDSFLFLMRFRPWFEEHLNDNGEAQILEDRIEALKGELLSAEKNVKKVNALILADDNPPKSLVQTLKDWEQRVEYLRSVIVHEEGKRVDAKQADPDFFKNLPEKMKSVEYRLKVREVLRGMINCITIYADCEFPHYVIERTTGSIWSVVFSDVSRKHRNFQIHKGKVTTFQPKSLYEGDGVWRLDW